MEDLLTLGYFVSQGKEGGLEGTRLLEWAEEKLEKAEAKAEAKAKLDRERDERAAEREAAKIASDDREKARLHEEKMAKIKSEETIKLRQLELNIPNEKHDEDNVKETDHSTKIAPTCIKLIGIHSGLENKDMGQIISLFEEDAKVKGLDKSLWCLELRKILLIRGCDEWLTELGVGLDYEKLKREALKHFSLTERGYSDKFNTVKPELEDKGSGYIRKVKHIFDKWVELSGIEKTYEEIVNLIIKDKIVRTIGEEVRRHVLSRETKTLDDVERSIENFLEIYPERQIGKTEENKEPLATISEINPIIGTQSPIRGSHLTTQGRKQNQDRYRSQSPPREYIQRYRSPSPIQRPYREQRYKSQSPQVQRELRFKTTDSHNSSQYSASGSRANKNWTQNNYIDGQQLSYSYPCQIGYNRCYNCNEEGHWKRDCKNNFERNWMPDRRTNYRNSDREQQRGRVKFETNDNR